MNGQKKPLVIAVDFDGVIHNPNDRLPGYKLGQPMSGANKALYQLKRDGAVIVILTVWADTQPKRDAISKWCRHFDIPYDVITNVKGNADIYIDDKGYRFENWNDTLKFIETLEN